VSGVATRRPELERALDQLEAGDVLVVTKLDRLARSTLDLLRIMMVVIDDSPECDRALYFESRRALRVGATVLMLRVIETRDRNQQWLGVADIMRAEAHEEANAVLDRHAARSSSITGVMPQRVIREGDKAQEVLNLIEDDEDIAALVLAAATSKEGPGPLVSSLAKNAGDFPIPVAIVPGHLSDEELDALS
jgi:nucleotide-binding universal stress UspA family protein